jgi:hypothetical protein
MTGFNWRPDKTYPKWYTNLWLGRQRLHGYFVKHRDGVTAGTAPSHGFEPMATIEEAKAWVESIYLLTEKQHD